MKSFFHAILFFIILTYSISCDNNSNYNDQDCDYTNCITQEPTAAQLKIFFNYKPIIYLCIGNYENCIYIDTINTDTIKTDSLNYWVPFNNKYTVIAQYIRNQDTIYAIDSKYVYKTSYQECDSICWETVNSDFNVKLKNIPQ